MAPPYFPFIFFLICFLCVDENVIISGCSETTSCACHAVPASPGWVLHPGSYKPKHTPFPLTFFWSWCFIIVMEKTANAQGSVVLREKKLRHLLGSQEYRVLFPQFLFQAHTIGVRLPFPS